MSTINRTFSVKNGLDVANTILIDSNRNLVNVGNVTPTGNNTQSLGSPTARFKDVYVGNSTIYIGETSLSASGDELVANTFNAAVSFVSGGLNVLNQANTARTTANDAYAQANTARTTANDAYAQANTARNTANDAYAAANTANTNALNAYSQANTARDTANSSANTVRVSANGGSTLSSKQLNFVNTATAIITVSDASDGNANITVNVIGGGAIGQAYNQANTARDTANDAYAQANAAYGQANAAYSTANAKIETINQAGAIEVSSGSVNNVVSYTINVKTADTSTVGVTKLVDSVSSLDTGNAATANAVSWAYEYANTMLKRTGGTVSGDLTVQGNLFLTGNATYINTSSIVANDTIIILGANNIADAVDIGFAGHYSEDGGTTNLHAGIVRHASDNVFYVFDGYGTEPTNNVIDVASANLAWLRANVNAAALLINGSVVATQANLTTASDQANAAYGQANAAYGQANTARGVANDAYAQANSGYAQANAAYGQANAARDQANTAYGQANDAYARANTKVSKSGDTMTGSLTINTGGVGLSVGNANVTFSLQVGKLEVTTNTVTTSSSGQVVLDKFSATDLASAKYFVQAKNGSNYHTTEIVLVQDETNVWLTEYGSIQTGPSLGTFTADIDSGDVRLLFNAVNNVNTIRSVRYGVAS